MKITFVRHGESECNLTKNIQDQIKGNLTKKGKEQAKKLGKRLAEEKFDIIYCSDSNRTKQTAVEIIKYHKEVPIVYCKELREIRRGKWIGKPGKELWEKMKKSGKTFAEFRPEGGESPKDLYVRIDKFLKKLEKKHKKEHILFITHGGVNKTIWFVCKNDPKISYKEEMKEIIAQDNCCVNVLEYVNNKPKLISYNCTRHLK